MVKASVQVRGAPLLFRVRLPLVDCFLRTILTQWPFKDLEQLSLATLACLGHQNSQVTVPFDTEAASFYYVVNLVIQFWCLHMIFKPLTCLKCLKLFSPEHHLIWSWKLPNSKHQFGSPFICVFP